MPAKIPKGYMEITATLVRSAIPTTEDEARELMARLCYGVPASEVEFHTLRILKTRVHGILRRKPPAPEPALPAAE